MIDCQADLLFNQFHTKDWFDSIGMDDYNRFVVYVKFMCQETLSIPDKVNGKQVLVHYADSINSTKEKYIEKLTFISSDDLSVLNLKSKLNNLRKMSGSQYLESIFFEVHDGNNAITNLSHQYPEVRKEMEDLYNQYGFDVIYDDLENP